MMKKTIVKTLHPQTKALFKFTNSATKAKFFGIDTSTTSGDPTNTVFTATGF